MDKFHLSLQNAQLNLFIFLGAVAAGTFAGGPIGDRIGRKYVIWASILGVLPFTLLLPYVNLLWTTVLSIVIGMILASAFSAILVYAQDLVPGRVGMISGLFFWLCLRFGRRRSRIVRQIGRLDLTHVCLPRVRIPSGYRHFDGIPARSGAGGRVSSSQKSLNQVQCQIWRGGVV